MIKACFFDIDGTLYSHRTNSVPKSALRALSLLREKGIMTVVCTGRSLQDYLKLPVAQVPFDSYLTLNGQLCYDADKKMFAGNPIPETDVEILSMMFIAERIPMTLVDEKGPVLNFSNDVVLKTQSDANEAVPALGALKGKKIYQVSAFADAKERKLLERILDFCDITSWHETGIDIVAKGSGKDVGMRFFNEVYGILPSETMAFGDSENDLKMLKFAGIGVAMGNATAEVKAAADYITDDIDEDGISNALKHFGLIEGGE